MISDMDVDKAWEGERMEREKVGDMSGNRAKM
jgi:hypothetical protein